MSGGHCRTKVSGLPSSYCSNVPCRLSASALTDKPVSEQCSVNCRSPCALELMPLIGRQTLPILQTAAPHQPRKPPPALPVLHTLMQIIRSPNFQILHALLALQDRQTANLPSHFIYHKMHACMHACMSDTGFNPIITSKVVDLIIIIIVILTPYLPRHISEYTSSQTTPTH